jgi:hypothetical protein
MSKYELILILVLAHIGAYPILAQNMSQYEPMLLAHIDWRKLAQMGSS